ncbi:curved DNA-binding protein CbpA [Sagittula marina]|uniref:Curved DNA-binding protein CbpA n=1 Tax=Sagittula marina TaxID=943940 RepID=A0A7W6DT39_9RHOB|nr:J domain-containing protein [Sagittula marina]MBB3985573.1 curved DNA-binding protein CbpA [Sagittula marina]
MARTSGTQTPFQTLGVTAADDQATIRAAYKRLVRANHPDRCPADAAHLNAKLAELNAAYDKLRHHTPFRRAGRKAERKQPDFSAENDARQAAAAQAQAFREQQASVKAAAEAKARADRARHAEDARKAAAERAARAEQARQNAARSAKPFTQAERKALATASRAFASARAALDTPQPPAFKRAA